MDWIQFKQSIKNTSFLLIKKEKLKVQKDSERWCINHATYEQTIVRKSSERKRIEFEDWHFLLCTVNISFCVNM